jgi:SAM-dependent methyltransferase
MDAAFWNDRYSAADYVYGTAPNEFIAEIADRIPAGPVLCLAEGEGRNAVFLAGRGHEVTAVDQSATGLAKARQLAAKHGRALHTIVADLSTFHIAPNSWAGIVTTFGHLPSVLRREVYAGAVRGLIDGGVFALEAYTPAQLQFNTGGPREIDLLMTASALRADLAGLEFEILHEIERNVTEGPTHHTGHGAVVQVLARKPKSTPSRGEPRR